MNLKHPIVILFGAGATRGGLTGIQPPPPLDTDFFDIANQLRGHGTAKLAKTVLADVWALYRHVSGQSLEAYYRDIETRAIIGRIAKSQHKPKDWQANKKNLEELIRRVLIHTTCDIDNSPVKSRASESHREILKRLTAGDTILTFNYDTLIEESFDKKPLWTPRDGYGEGFYGVNFDWAKAWLSDRNVPKSKQSEILLLKLHGSLNWTYGTAGIRMKPRPYMVRTKNGRPSFEKVSILPPGWNKRVDKNPYRKVWQVARRHLEKCQTLVVIGYSLPETDRLANALFAEVSRHRAACKKLLKQFHLADPSESVKQKLVDLFTPALGANGQVFRYNGIKELAEVWQTT